MNWSDIRRFWCGPTLDDLDIPREPRADPPIDKVELGQAAKRLLDDPIFNFALDRVQANLAATWRNSATGDVQVREEAYRLHWAAEALKTELRLMVATAINKQ